MLLGDILNVCLLMFGSAFCVILGKCLLKFYSTILFADINIFTHLNKAAVIAIQLMVQSRVGVTFTTHVLKDIFHQILIEVITRTHPVPVYIAIPLRVSFFVGVHFLFGIFTFSTAFRMVLIFKVYVTYISSITFSCG